MKPLSVTIGIVAHNEQDTIRQLLLSLYAQKIPAHFRLVRIVVISDGSTDATVINARSAAHRRLSVVAHRKQLGKGARLNELFMHNQSDILVLMDADILLDGKLVISRLIAPFALDKHLGLVCGNPVPLPSNTLAGRASTNWINTLIAVRGSMRSGDNPYSACGPIMALSRIFTQNLEIPGNVPDDRYLYFANRQRGLSFRYVPEAKIWFRSAENETDLLIQGSRYRSAFFLLAHHVGNDAVAEAFKLSPMLRVHMLRMQLTRDPVAYFYMKYLHMKLVVKTKMLPVDVWQPVKTSKHLPTLTI